LEEGRLRVVGSAGDESEQVVLEAAQDEGCQMFVEAPAEKTVLSVSGLLGTAGENRAAKALWNHRLASVAQEWALVEEKANRYAEMFAVRAIVQPFRHAIALGQWTAAPYTASGELEQFLVQ
jgi:erythromycin esterase-like protein